jgi:site-specific DNA recombinase
LDLVAAGGVDVVVVMFRDRLARGIHAGLLAEEFKEHGCQLVALNAHVDDSPEGELQGGLLDLFASYERSVFRRRAERGVAQKVKQGKLIRGPRAPYGFSYSEDGESLVVSEPKMATVRQIFHSVGAEGQTLGALIKDLTREGIPSPTGGNWQHPTLRYLILSELYWPRPLEELESLVSSGVLARLDPRGATGCGATTSATS